MNSILPNANQNATKPDVILIGAGIMSATLGVLLKEVEPALTIVMFETLHDCAQESSHGWNNAGTARPPWVPGELPALPAAETRAARKLRTTKKWDGEILRDTLGTWAILFVAFSALVSLIERDRPDLLSSGNPFAIGAICASVVTMLFFGFAWLHSVVSAKYGGTRSQRRAINGRY